MVYERQHITKSSSGIPAKVLGSYASLWQYGAKDSCGLRLGVEACRVQRCTPDPELQLQDV